MSIIISKNLKNAVKLDRSSFALEDNLQQYIYDNPESIPLYDIKEDIRLLILTREFPTASGPIDAIGVDKDGELYLVETKLYKNPDKRTVVAQVLDYGASLWKTYTDFDVFISQLEIQVTKKFNKTLNERVKDFFNLQDEQINQFNENLRDNLDDGNFKFVVLMDQIHGQLKDLIIFINQNSRFNIYGVELEYYKYESFEILIPKLFGAQVKKEVGTKKLSQTIPTDEEFISAYKNKGLSDKVKEFVDIFNNVREGRINITGLMARKTPKYLNFNFVFPNEEKSTLSVSLGINPDYETAEGEIHFGCSMEKEQVVKKAIQNNFKQIIVRNEITRAYGKIAIMRLKDFSSKDFQNFFIDLSQ
jgi:hypothetical protein